MTPQSLASMEMSERITAVCNMSDDEIAKFATWYSTELNCPWTSIVCSLAGRLISPGVPQLDRAYRSTKAQLFPEHQR